MSEALPVHHELVTVLSTASSADEAGRLAQALLERRLAACVNIVPGVESRYWWEGHIESAQEVLLVIKSQRSLLDELTQAIRELHSYSVPEVIALPIVGGNPGYLAWVAAESTSAHTTGR